jgi:anhydro-N-acetylmuramic acid kinase
MSDAAQVIVGLMSGTSLDGISAAAVRFSESTGRLSHELLAFETIPYTDAQRERVAAAMHTATAEQYCALNFEMGDWFAAAALGVMRHAGLSPVDVRAIASHGQTLWHTPRIATWQTGEAAVIAERTGIDVISDFRVRDVAAGGEGAPLVPIADALLYSADTDWRLLQNIGGIGNVTVVPPAGVVDRVRAFDTGPGVVLIDHLVRLLYGDRRFDDGGQIARSGKVNEAAVRSILGDTYFLREPPKSTGREYFGAAFAERMLSLIGSDAPPEDMIATATAVTARSIADAVRSYVKEPVTEMIVSGGGARNDTLIQMLRDALHPLKLVRFEQQFYDGDAKEAVAFALLGYLHLARRPANVIGATGARGPRVLGKLSPA